MSSIEDAFYMTCDTLMMIPLIYFCFLPVYKKARTPLPQLIMKIIIAVIIMELLMFCIFLISISEASIIFAMVLLTIVFFYLYQKEITIERSHSWFIFVTAGLIGSFGYMIYQISNIFQGSWIPFTSFPGFHSLFSQLFFECLLILITYYPTRHYLSWMVCHFHEEKLWRIAWIFPVSFIILSKSLIPYDNEQLFTGKAMEMYLVFLFVFLIIICFLYIMFFQVAYRMVEKQEILEKNSYLELQSEQYRRLQDHVQETKRIRHDFHHQLIVLGRMITNKEYDVAEEFLNAYRDDIRYSVRSYCDITAVNAVLNHYADLCHEEKIIASFQVQINEKGMLKDIDICVLLGNLLENAVYGCKSIEHEKGRTIQLKIGQTTSNIIVLTIRNPFVQQIKKDGDTFLSSRHSGEGQGIKSVRLIAEKYDGFVKINYDKQQFTVHVLLNI